MRIITAACALLLIAALASPALADERSSRIDRGIALYNDLEYEAAIETLEKALERPSKDRAKNVDGFKALAMSYLALGQDERALITFERLLELEPRYRLPSTLSEQAQELFERAKKRRADKKRAPDARPDGGREVTLEHRPVGRLRRDRAAEIAIDVVSDPDRRHRRIVLFHRAPGDDHYSSVWAKAQTRDRYQVTIGAGAMTSDRLELYVWAVDDAGDRVGAIGSPGQPIEIAIGGAAPRGPGPVYSRWWFWAGVGSALVAGVIVADRVGSDAE